MPANPRDPLTTGSNDGGRNPLPLALRQRLQQVFEHGKRSFDKGDFDYAHDLFTQCVVEDPSSVIYWQHFRANLQRKHGEKKKVGRFANLRLKSHRSPVAKPVEKGQWREAFQTGCDVLRSDPWNLPTLLEMANACGELQHRECQLFFLRWALDVDASNVDANRQAAVALGEVGQFDQAIACWKRVQELKPDDQEPSKEVSRLSVEKTIQSGGYNPELLHGAADVTWQKEGVPGQWKDEEPAEEAGTPEERILRRIEQDPADVSAYVQLAELHTARGRFADAERALSKALSVSGGGDLRIRELLEDAQLRRLHHQVDVANHRAASMGTEEAQDLARRMLAQAHQTELEIYAARVQRRPGDADLRFELALRLKRLGKYREAVQSFQAARSDRRRLAEIELHLGECFQHIEQFRLAMASYESALAACEATQTDMRKLALYRAGVLAIGLKDLDRAERHLTDLAALDFGYRDVADRLDKIAQLRNHR